MKLSLAIFLLGASLSVRAQTVANPSNVLHPILKDIHGPREAPTSVNRNPGLASDLESSTPGNSTASSSAYGQAVQPTEIVARIDSGLAASKVSVVGTVSGLKGRLYVTNNTAGTVVPSVQLAVCNDKGVKIGAASKTGLPLSPNDSEKIEVFATNANAVDLKLMKLSIQP